MASKGQLVDLDWNCITWLHSQVMTGTHELTNSITLSHWLHLDINKAYQDAANVTA